MLVDVRLTETFRIGKASWKATHSQNFLTLVDLRFCLNCQCLFCVSYEAFFLMSVCQVNQSDVLVQTTVLELIRKNLWKLLVFKTHLLFRLTKCKFALFAHSWFNTAQCYVNNTLWSIKNMPLLFFEWLCKTLANFNSCWHATSQRNLTQMPIVLPTAHLTLILLLHYLVKCSYWTCGCRVASTFMRLPSCCSRKTFWAYGVTLVTFWEMIIANCVCNYSVNHFWAGSCATQYEFIVVIVQTTTSAFHSLV